MRGKDGPRWQLLAAGESRGCVPSPARHRAGTTSVGSCVGTNERRGKGERDIRDVYAWTYYKYSRSPHFQ